MKVRRRRPATTVPELAEEIATFEAQRRAFLKSHRGQFVLIKGKRVVGFFEDEVDAIRHGYRMLGDVGFLVQKIEEHETPVMMPTIWVVP